MEKGLNQHRSRTENPLRELPQESRINTTILVRTTASVVKKITDEYGTTEIDQDVFEEAYNNDCDGKSDRTGGAEGFVAHAL